MDKWSRRDILQAGKNVGMTAGSLYVVGFLGGPVANTYLRDRYTQESSERESVEAKMRIKERHDVDVNVDVPTELRSGRDTVPVTPNDSAYIRMCTLREFEKYADVYPPHTIGKFVSNIHIGDFPLQNESGGFMTPDGNTLAIRLTSFFASHRNFFGTLLSPSTTNHEIGHGMTKEHIFIREVSAEFGKLNPEPSYVGMFFKSLYPGEKVNEPVPGFVRAYGMSEIHEDIATVIELLFQGVPAVEKRLQLEDSKLAPPGHKWHGILRKKVTEVKRILHNKVPAFDDTFWQDVNTPHMKDPKSYWDSRGFKQ